MELVGRMLDGSIPYSVKSSLQHTGLFGARVSQDDKITRLAETPLFEGCSRRQLKAVARISDVRAVPAGTVLTRKGEDGDEFFLILDGKARAIVTNRKRSSLGPDGFFGEMSLLDGGPRSATVVAETAMRLLVIRRQDFSRLLSEVPDLTRSLLAVLSRRLRQAEQAPNA